MIKFVLLLFVVSFHSTLITAACSTSLPRRIAFHNQWELSDLYLQRWENETTGSPISAIFNVYRSYFVGCGGGVASIMGLLVGELCETWRVPDNPIACTQGFDMVHSRPSTLPTSKSGWFTCDRYLRLPEGEQDIPEEKQKWLKWRVFDLQERNITNNSEKTPFVSAKLEFINGIPIKSPDSNTTQIKVRSILYNIKNQDGFDCFPSVQKELFRYECVFRRAPMSIGPDKCNPALNVTEKIESIGEWNDRFKGN